MMKHKFDYVVFGGLFSLLLFYNRFLRERVSRNLPDNLTSLQLVIYSFFILFSFILIILSIYSIIKITRNKPFVEVEHTSIIFKVLFWLKYIFLISVLFLLMYNLILKALESIIIPMCTSTYINSLKQSIIFMRRHGAQIQAFNAIKPCKYHLSDEFMLNKQQTLKDFINIRLAESGINRFIPRNSNEIIFRATQEYNLMRQNYLKYNSLENHIMLRISALDEKLDYDFFGHLTSAKALHNYSLPYLFPTNVNNFMNASSTPKPQYLRIYPHYLRLNHTEVIHNYPATAFMNTSPILNRLYYLMRTLEFSSNNIIYPTSDEPFIILNDNEHAALKDNNNINNEV